MTNAPTCLRTWQEREQEYVPTCYEDRNPAAPWRAAADQLTEDFEDIEFARGWANSCGRAGSLGDVQLPTAPCDTATRRGKAPSLVEVRRIPIPDAVNADAAVLSLSVSEQIAGRLRAWSDNAAITRAPSWKVTSCRPKHP